MPLLADRYEMGPVIGQGGMAEVYSARDTRLDRPVAIKVMRAEVAYQRLVRERFEAEAKMAARLVHPNVVSVFDSGEQDGIPYIVMELLSGETLRDRMRSGPMAEPEVRTMAAEVLSALDLAHRSGILHRDIKPANILAAGGGHWKVADFGIAKALEVDQGDATATGLVLGTPAYLAPERFFGSPATVASDLYSLGVIMYEALGGRRPYETRSADAWPAVVAGPPAAPLTELRPGLDPVLVGVVTTALAREPAARFGSAGEMASALGGAGGVVAPEAPATAVMSGAPATEVMAAAPATEVMRRPDPVGAGPDRTEVYPGPGPSRRRPPAGAVLGGLALLAALIGVIIAVVAANHHSGGGSPGTSTAKSTVTSTLTTAAPSSSPSTSPTTSPTTTATTPAPTTAEATTTTEAPTTTTTVPASTTVSSTTPVISITLPGSGSG